MKYWWVLMATCLVAEDIPAQDVIGDAHARSTIARYCGRAAAPSVDDLLRVESALADSVRRNLAPPDSFTWRLACIRTHLGEVGIVSRASYRMPVGTSWRQGATDLLLDLAPNDSSGGTTELIAAINHDPVLALHPSHLLPAYERAIGSGEFSQLTARACVAAGQQLDSPGAIQRCAESALAVGVDSTFHLLAIAELQSAAGDTSRAWQSYLNAARAADDPTSRADLTWHLRWILSPEELTTWSQADPDEIPGLAKAMFVMRDVRDGRRPGARIVEHFLRLRTVRRDFGMQVLPIHRQRLLAGPAISDGPTDRSTEVTRYSGGSDVGADIMRDFARWQTDFDDRGAVWMRFGQPAKRTFYTVTKDGGLFGIYIKRETWRYDLDGHELLLSFESEQGDGSEEATRLVSGVVGEHFCGIDARRCFQGTRAWAAAEYNRLRAPSPVDRAGIAMEEMGRLQQADRRQIREATTKDDNSERFPEHLTVSAHLHRLWHPVTGRGIILAPWAVKASTLDTRRVADGREASLTLVLRASDPVTGGWWDSTMTRHLRLPAELPGGAHVTGVIEADLLTTASAWSLVARQGDERGGRVFDVRSPSLADGALVLSDLVVGSERQGLSWDGGGEPITLAPLGAVDRNEPVALYFQIRSEDAHDTITTAIAVYRTDGGERQDLIALGLSGRVPAGLTEVRRMIGVERLEPGSYWLEVRLSAPHGLHAARAAPLRLR